MCTTESRRTEPEMGQFPLNEGVGPVGPVGSRGGGESIFYYILPISLPQLIDIDSTPVVDEIQAKTRQNSIIHANKKEAWRLSDGEKLHQHLTVFSSEHHTSKYFTLR